jgi:hypothetical protein
MSRTWCNTCQAFVPISDFEWFDTGEKISDYYARHSARVRKLERFLCSKAFLIVCGVTGFLPGAIGGYLRFRNNRLWMQVLMVPFTGFVGLIIVCSLNLLVLEKFIVKRVCGVSDSRLLT